MVALSMMIPPVLCSAAKQNVLQFGEVCRDGIGSGLGQLGAATVAIEYADDGEPGGVSARDVVAAVADHDGARGIARPPQRGADDGGFIGARAVAGCEPQMAVKYCARSKCSRMRTAIGSGFEVAMRSVSPVSRNAARKAAMPG